MEKLRIINPMFLTTRETFPGEKSFEELSRQYFGIEPAINRVQFIAKGWEDQGLLVHMANPEQIDDLFSHIDRQSKVRFLSTSYIHTDIRPTVYAIGRGTGIILDGDCVQIDHVSKTDSDTVTAPGDRLVVKDHEKLAGIKELHEALLDKPSQEWNEVNVSFEGASCIKGIFSLDGVMSKLYATTLHMKSGGLLPVFTYNKGMNKLEHFVPTAEEIESLIEEVPVANLRNRYRLLLDEIRG